MKDEEEMKRNHIALDQIWNLEETELKKAKKQTWKSIFKAIGVVFFILMIVISLGIYGTYRLLASACENEVVSEISQPDGTYKAIVFIRNCGATTRESYQVSILRRGSSIDSSDTGNVFITYSPVSITWSRKNNLDIEYGSGQIFKQESRYKGIEINYK